jgi:flavin-dependent dehydrogenase
VADTSDNIGETSNNTWPIVIVGAGPAGSVCALSLARAGHQVLLLDKYDFPRDKTCGDQLIPDSLKVLAQLNLLDRVRPLALANDRIRVFSPGRIDFIVRCDYFAIKRRDFDHVMVQAATEAGATFAKAKVVDVKPAAYGSQVTKGHADQSSRGPDPVGAVAISNDDATISRLPRFDVPPDGGSSPLAMTVAGALANSGPSPLAMTNEGAPSQEILAEVYVDGRAEPLRARVVVIATGASIHLADKLDLIDRRAPSAVAMRAYFESDYQLAENVLSYDRSLAPGYGWIFQVGPNLFNVGCGHLVGPDKRGDNLRAIVESFLADFPIARDLIARGRRVSEFEGAPIRCGLDGCRDFRRDNVLLVGETVGATFPFTGEGIGKAMQSAMIAGEVIDRALRAPEQSILDDYTRRIETELRPLYHGYRIAEKWFARPWVCDLIARRIRGSGHLQEQLAHLAAETGDPRGLFSVRSLLKSFWK